MVITTTGRQYLATRRTQYMQCRKSLFPIDLIVVLVANVSASNAAVPDTQLSTLVTRAVQLPQEGFVPDSETAIEISKTVLKKIIGTSGVVNLRIFKANLYEGIWIVQAAQRPVGVGGAGAGRA